MWSEAKGTYKIGTSAFYGMHYKTTKSSILLLEDERPPFSKMNNDTWSRSSPSQFLKD